MSKVKAFFKTLITPYDESARRNKLKEELGLPILRPKNAHPITEYETRRKEISDSSEPVEGIFYIIDDEIVMDFYSEVLFSEARGLSITAEDFRHPHKGEMFHDFFYTGYIRKVYKDVAVSDDPKSLPRGRVGKFFRDDHASIYIDFCYLNNIELVILIARLYRLTGRIEVVPSKDCRCPGCPPSTDEHVMKEAYTLIEKDDNFYGMKRQLK